MTDPSGFANGTRRRHEGLQTGSMSTARDEADEGPELPTGNGGDETCETGIALEERFEVSDERGEPGQSEDSASLTLQNDYQENLAQEEDSHNGSPSSPQIDRLPSSADGSLSIPDDTPSFQVSSCTDSLADLTS